MKLFYGFQYDAGTSTTYGEPHPQTGRMSIAGDLVVFTSKSERDEWVDATTDKTREAVTRQKARSLCAGWSKDQFDAWVRYKTPNRWIHADWSQF